MMHSSGHCKGYDRWRAFSPPKGVIMYRASENTENLLKAMVEAAPDLRAVSKNKEGYGYRYASLDSIIDVLREALPKHGLWFSQIPSTLDDGIELRTRVFHVSGEWFEDSIIFGKTELQKANDTQKLGASITYFRRYALASIFGIASDEDTDAAAPRPQRAPEASQKPAGRDPTPYLSGIMARRLKAGEAKESILRDFADVLQTDALRDIPEMSDKERRIVANAMAAREKARKVN